MIVTRSTLFWQQLCDYMRKTLNLGSLLFAHGVSVGLVSTNLKPLDQFDYLCPLAQYGTSPDELFLYTVNPLESQVTANSWLQVPASEGHNILIYLETESVLHTEPMQSTHPSYLPMGEDNEPKLVFDVGPRPSLSRDWWISKSSSTFLLHAEFKSMTLIPLDWWLQVRSWKRRLGPSDFQNGLNPIICI